MSKEFYFPGGDGKWESAPVPETLVEAQERIRVLQAALAFYSDARSYNPHSRDNEFPSFWELLKDRGLRARVGRLALSVDEFRDWLRWCYEKVGEDWILTRWR